jgi:predicted PurR-regulated permease PerM
MVIPTPPPAAHVPPGVDVAVAWVWRVLVLSAGVVLLGVALGRVVLLTASLLGGLLLTALLQPLALRAQRTGLPRRVAAVATFAGFVLLAGLALALLGRAVASQLADVAGSLAQGCEQLLDALRSSGLPLDEQQLQELRQQARKRLDSAVAPVFAGALTAAGTFLDVVSGLVLALFVALVLLLDGRTVWRWVLSVLPGAARQPADEAGGVAWDSLTSYVRGISLVALTDATLIALALLVIGVPSVAPLAALTFVAAFLPYLGAATAGLTAVAVALATEGGTAALLTLAAVVIVQLVDGYVLEPLVLGKAVHLHPLAVVVVITLGGLLAGIGGAVIAVPLAGALNAAVVHLAHRGDEGHRQVEAARPPPSPA